MIISFVEIERDDERYFAGALHGHTLHFARALDELPPETEILSPFIYTCICAEKIRHFPHLKLITTRSIRFDHIDVMLCRVRGIRVCHIPTYQVAGMAEHTFALILALARRLPKLLDSSKTGFSFAATRAFHLEGRTLGVIGTGRVGQRVIELARAFRMRVIACDEQPDPALPFQLGFDYAPLEEVLARADILTLHTPLAPDTYGLLNRSTLGLCKRGVYIVNTARGALIDTDALLEGLDSGQIAGAGLDVLEQDKTFPQEPINTIREQIIEHVAESGETPAQRSGQRVHEIQRLMRNSAIIHRENVIYTPHVGFNSVEVNEELNRRTLENIAHFLRGTPINEVDYFAP